MTASATKKEGTTSVSVLVSEAPHHLAHACEIHPQYVAWYFITSNLVKWILNLYNLLMLMSWRKAYHMIICVWSQPIENRVNQGSDWHLMLKIFSLDFRPIPTSPIPFLYIVSLGKGGMCHPRRYLTTLLDRLPFFDGQTTCLGCWAIGNDCVILHYLCACMPSTPRLFCKYAPPPWDFGRSSY